MEIGRSDITIITGLRLDSRLSKLKESVKMIDFYSEYYEKEINISGEEQEILFDIYIKIAKKLGFEPEVKSPEEIDNYYYDHVAYHVEEFGKNYPEYAGIVDLFISE